MLDIKEHIETLEKSDLFDADWYLEQYPDVALLELNPAEHYLRWGARLHRDPGPSFSTGYYLRANPDVAKTAANPLVHYIKHGAAEGRAAVPHTLTRVDAQTTVDIVVPVYNALPDVKLCLTSLVANYDCCSVHTIVVNDGSDAETRDWLRAFSQKHRIQLLEHSKNLGYTRAVNTGLRASSSRYVVALNSDTIVSRGWLRALIRCMVSAPDIGIVGPLSNAASWQNVPELHDSSGHFAINSLPADMSVDEMAALVAHASAREYPRTTFVNGFCFMIRREVIDAIGYMDEENFPYGYGEENDFCIRAADAGFALAIADDSYVYHSKSKSFGHERRRELSRRGSEELKTKHTHEKVGRLVQEVKQFPAMDRVRARVRTAEVAHKVQSTSIDAMALRILFLLPVSGGGGGAHSVVQEATEMYRLGLRINVAVDGWRVGSFLAQYEDIPEIANIIIGFDEADLLRLASDYDIVVGTIYSSMNLISRICKAFPHILPAYYVQDYEPLFSPSGTSRWQVARDSYDLVPRAVLFAKTHWIIDKVAAEHGRAVRKVEPSIDHVVYRPAPRVFDGRIHIAAMIRPQTPRRGAERTMRVFAKLAKRHPGQLKFHLFGCAEDDEDFLKLSRDFEFVQHGVLLRPDVALLLSRCDIFVDLSDYQAFGRTALEAMACGCTAVVPVHGGTDEYAVNGTNALVVDTFDEDVCLIEIDKLVSEPLRLQRMRVASLGTAARYSVHRAAVSEWTILSQSLAEHRKAHPKPRREKLVLLPATTKGRGITGSGYVRTVLPYCSEAILNAWSVTVQQGPLKLPVPGSAKTVLIQRDAFGISLANLHEWREEWLARGGKIIYEVDDDLLDPSALNARAYTGDVAVLQEKVRWLAQKADLVTASTEPLAEKLRSLNKNVRVVPNRLDRTLWGLDKPREHRSGPFARSDKKVRVGYVGTPSHDKDLEMVAEALRRIERDFADRVEVEVIGGFELCKPKFGRRVALPIRKDYPDFVQWLRRRVHWDIGIIPLVDNEFNRSKSYIKFLEYAALDMAIICSKVACYEEIAINGENSLVVENESRSWYESIKELLFNESLRVSLATTARDFVSKFHVLDQASQEYIDVLKAPDESRHSQSAIAAKKNP